MRSNASLELKFLLGVLRPYRRLIAIIVVTSFLSSLCDGISIGMLIPLLSNIQGSSGGSELPPLLQRATEMLAAYPLRTQVFLCIGLVVAAILLKNVLLAVSIWYGYRVSSGLAAELRTRAASMFLNVGSAYHDRNKAGDLIEKTVFSTGSLEELVRNGVEMIAQVITLLVLLALLVLLSWKLTLVTIAIGAGFLWLTSAYNRRLRAIGEEFAASSRGLVAGVHESLAGVSVIKAYVQERLQEKRLQKSIDRQRRASHSLNFGNYVVHLLTDVVGALAIGVLFAVTVAIYGVDSRVLIVLLFPFIYVITRIIPVVKQINIARAVIAGRWAFLRAVHDFLRLDDKPFVASGTREFDSLSDAIRFEGVSFRYEEDGEPALDGVSFTIAKGATTALVGRSGSGKSTVIRLLQRKYDPQQGRILVDGVPIQSFDAKSFRSRLGVVSQDVFVFHDTVRFNIGFGVDDPEDRRVVAAARLAGAHEFVSQLPDGYDTILGDRGVRLSGGQRQRISIARAILRDPDILILDEATSSLDTRTEEQIHRAIVDLARDRTVIVIAHRLSTIQSANRIVVLRDGRVVEEGRPEELVAAAGEFRWLTEGGSDASVVAHEEPD